MLVECSRCGAPIDTEAASTYATCTYCGNKVRVKTTRTLSIETPPGWKPPQTWAPTQNPNTQAEIALARARQLAKQQAGGHGARAGGDGVRTLGCFLVFMTALPGLIGGGIALSTSGALSGTGIAAFAPPALDPAQPGALGRIELDTQPTRTVTGVTPGPDDGFEASTLGTSGCTGRVVPAPALQLVTTGPRLLTVRATSSGDTSIVLRRADGSLVCNDDTNGTNPEVSVPVPAGMHQVWVGAVGSAYHIGYSLRVDSEVLGAMPDATGLAPDAPPAQGTIDLDATPTRTVSVQAHARVRPEGLPSDCSGSFAMVPSLALQSTTQRAFAVEASGEGSLHIAARSPDGTWRCEHGRRRGMPAISGLVGGAAGGSVLVWFGVPGSADDLALTVRVESTPMDATPLPNGLAPDASPRFGRFELATLRPGHRVDGQTFAMLDASDIWGECRGEISAAPDVVLDVAAGSAPIPIRLLTQSRSSDLTLVVQGPDGNYHCDDDSGGGNNAQLSIEPSPGRYAIWVGDFRGTGSSWGLVINAAVRSRW